VAVREAEAAGAVVVNGGEVGPDFIVFERDEEVAVVDGYSLASLFRFHHGRRLRQTLQRQQVDRGGEDVAWAWVLTIPVAATIAYSLVTLMQMGGCREGRLMVDEFAVFPVAVIQGNTGSSVSPPGKIVPDNLSIVDR
jgi:hypothetical protein